MITLMRFVVLGKGEKMDKQTAIKRITNLIDPYPCFTSLHPLTCEALEMAIEALKQQEVIRCSDCEYCTEASLLSTPKPVNWCTQWVMKTEPDWYCSRAERKADK